MVHFWTLLFWYDFSLNDLKYVSINPLHFLCPINPFDKVMGQWNKKRKVISSLSPAGRLMFQGVF